MCQGWGLTVYWYAGIPIGIFFSLIFGLPAHYLFKKLGIDHWLSFVSAGSLMAVPFWLLSAPGLSSEDWWTAGAIGHTLIYLGSGSLAGLLFWKFSSPINVHEKAS